MPRSAANRLRDHCQSLMFAATSGSKSAATARGPIREVRSAESRSSNFSPRCSAQGGRRLFSRDARREGAHRGRDYAVHRRRDVRRGKRQDAASYLPHQCRRRRGCRSRASAWLRAAGTEGSFIPFIVVRGGLTARLARPVYYELAALAMTASGGRGRACGAEGRSSRFPGRRKPEWLRATPRHSLCLPTAAMVRSALAQSGSCAMEAWPLDVAHCAD